jgi:hypothetical protein
MRKGRRRVSRPGAACIRVPLKFGGGRMRACVSESGPPLTRCLRCPVRWGGILERELHEGGPAKFGAEVGQVGLHRPRRDEKPCGDALVGLRVDHRRAGLFRSLRDAAEQ